MTTSGTCSPVCHDRMNEVLGSSFAPTGHPIHHLGGKGDGKAIALKCIHVKDMNTWKCSDNMSGHQR